MGLLSPCNTKGHLLVKIQQTQQMCLIIFLGLLNSTYLILNIIFGKFQQTKLKKYFFKSKLEIPLKYTMQIRSDYFQV